MRQKGDQQIYEAYYPATYHRGYVRVTCPDSSRIDFGITSVRAIETDGGPGMLVDGSEKESDWANPAFTEFLVDVGKAQPEKGTGVACFEWRGKYWVRAVRPDRKAAMTYGDKRKGQSRIVRYLLLPIDLRPTRLQ